MQNTDVKKQESNCLLDPVLLNRDTTELEGATSTFRSRLHSEREEAALFF